MSASAGTWEDTPDSTADETRGGPVARSLSTSARNFFLAWTGFFWGSFGSVDSLTHSACPPR